MDEKVVGRRIKAARQVAGLTQGQVGKRLAPPRSHAAVSDIERAVTGITVGLLDQLARILGVTVASFLGWEGGRYGDPLLPATLYLICPHCGRRAAEFSVPQAEEVTT